MRLFVCLSCIALSGELVAAPTTKGLTFVKDRRAFLNMESSAVTSDTIRLPKWERKGLEEQGYDPPALDAETGLPYFSQRSAFTIRPDPKGDLVVHREQAAGSRVPAMTSDAESLKIPIVSDPGAALVPLLAHHPLAMAMEDFGLLPRFRTPVETRETSGTLMEAFEDAQWRFEVDRDAQTRHPREVRQIHKADRILVERARYDGWYQAPSGRWIPRTATLRTFKGDVRHPVVQVEFSDIRELPD